MTRSSTLTLLAAVLSLSACGGSASSSPDVVAAPSGSGTAITPTGGWVLDVERSGLEFPDWSSSTMVVDEDGTISGTSPCNDWTAEADIAADGAWSLREFGTNDGGCVQGTEEAQDTLFAALWEATSWDRTDDRTLVLAGGPHPLTFRADEPLDIDLLLDTTWEVVTIETDGTSRAVRGGVPTPTFTYSGDASGGTFTQHTGCREATGEWVARGGRVVHTAWRQVGDIDVFEDCDEDQVATEQAVHVAFGGFRLDVGDDAVVFRSGRDTRNALVVQPADSGGGDAVADE